MTDVHALCVDFQGVMTHCLGLRVACMLRLITQALLDAGRQIRRIVEWAHGTSSEESGSDDDDDDDSPVWGSHPCASPLCSSITRLCRSVRCK